MAKNKNDDAEPTGAVIEPLDGPVYDPATDPASAEPVRLEGNRGQTLLRARRGYAFNSNVEGIPVITAAGVYVTAEQAEQILAEDEPTGIVYKVDQEGE